MMTAIPLRGRGTFTVTARDEMDGVPDFTTIGDDKNDTVRIDAPYGEVRGTMVNSADVLTLDADTGMGTFTYTLLRDAMDGELFHIYVGEGDMQVEIMVYAGTAPAEPTVPGMPMMVEAMAQDHMSIKVSWMAPEMDGYSDITGYIIERRYGDMMFLDHADTMGDVFTDAMSWWDGLGCEAMVMAVMDDGMADMDNPFCMMYDDLADADRMTVAEYFK